MKTTKKDLWVTFKYCDV